MIQQQEPEQMFYPDLIQDLVSAEMSLQRKSIMGEGTFGQELRAIRRAVTVISGQRAKGDA